MERTRFGLGLDTRRTHLIQAAGWRVVRIREAPLKRLTEDDLVVPRNITHKHRADEVLRHLTSQVRLQIDGLDRYLNTATLAAQTHADTFLDVLRKEALEAKLIT